jgi:hypothetical protein
MLRVPLVQALRRHGWTVALGAWFVGLSLLAAGMLARHTVALPSVTDRAGPALGTLRSPDERGRWLSVHALYAECSCSRLISAHLLRSDRPAGYSEIVLWAGDGDPDPELARHGFRVVRVSRDALARYGIESVPTLVALDPDDHVRYAGGYTPRAPGLDPEDGRILAEARASRASPRAPLPVFGCAISERLRRALALLPTP